MRTSLWPSEWRGASHVSLCLSLPNVVRTMCGACSVCRRIEVAHLREGITARLQTLLLQPLRSFYTHSATSTPSQTAAAATPQDSGFGVARSQPTPPSQDFPPPAQVPPPPLAPASAAAQAAEHTQTVLDTLQTDRWAGGCGEQGAMVEAERCGLCIAAARCVSVISRMIAGMQQSLWNRTQRAMQAWRWVCMLSARSSSSVHIIHPKWNPRSI
jgi:hypothetical protein